MNEKAELARDIYYTGSNVPEIIADYLISQGWSKRPTINVTQFMNSESVDQAVARVELYRQTKNRMAES